MILSESYGEAPALIILITNIVHGLMKQPSSNPNLIIAGTTRLQDVEWR